MAFSSFAYCAENKKLNFSPFMPSGTLIHQTSNMGMHHSDEMPFVELTGHKLQEPIVNSSFQINGFSIAGKIHSFTTNSKHFVRSDNILTRKDLYGHQFPAFSFSQLVGGFVGSKSQIGSSSKESCQMWDIIFDKLAEFCGTHHHSQNCYNFSKGFSQDVLKSFCKKDRPPCVVINNSANVTSNTGSKLGKLSSKPNCSQNVSDCSSQPSPDVSKQSYAEVARTFATVQQNKQSSLLPSVMPRKRNLPNRKNFVKCDISRTFTNNWRNNNCNPQIKQYRNHTKFFSGSQRRSDTGNKHLKSCKHFDKEQKTDRNRKHTHISEPQRVDSKKRMMSDSVQITPKISTNQECQKNASETFSGSSIKATQAGQTSPMRMRFLSECSTDSDDSFVVFDSEADCNSVIVAVISPSDSDISEDMYSYQFSDDEVDNTDCVDGDDTETVTELSELNERWERENSKYPTCKKNPVKVNFASDTLETVHPMIAWNFAYHAARCGPWEQMARDRERFKIRIKQVEPVLAKILSPKHRYRVWKERMVSAGT